MATMVSGTALRQIDLGLKVDRATGVLPQSTTTSIFTVAGGRVMITSLVGLVTTVVQAQATTLKLVATPTVGTVNDLCTTADLNAKIVGTMLGITGLASDALVPSTGGAIGVLTRPIIVAAGAIGALTVASSTGAVQWSITYVPYDDGATVVAA